MIDINLLDKILNSAPSDKGLTSMNFDNEEIGQELLDILESRGQIYQQGMGLYGLTDFGLDFRSKGGYLKEYEKEKINESDKELQRKNLVTTTKTAKWAIWLSALSLFVAALSLYVALYLAYKA